MNLDKNITRIKNMVLKGELDLGNLDKKVDLVKNKLFTHLLANQQKLDSLSKKDNLNFNSNKHNRAAE